MLPQAKAMGNIHMRDHCRKAERAFPRRRREAGASDQLSIPPPTCSVNSPFNKLRDSCGKLDDFEAARTLAACVGVDLAVLGWS